ncbi:MAG: hypothetical protein ACOCUS_00345 [Polyangiales bacterium]
MTRRLRSTLGRYGKARRHDPEPVPDVSGAQEDRLRALGYAQ